MNRALLWLFTAAALSASAQEPAWDDDALRIARDEWGPGGRHPADGLVAVPSDASVMAPLRRACRLFRLEHRFLTAGGRERMNPEIGIVWRDGSVEIPEGDVYDAVVRRAGLRADDEGRAAAAALRWTLDAWAHEESPDFAIESRRLEVDGNVATYRHFSLRYPGGFWLAQAFLVFGEGSVSIARRPSAIPRQLEAGDLEDFLGRAGPWLQVRGDPPPEWKERVGAAAAQARDARDAVAGWVRDLEAEEAKTRDAAEEGLKKCGTWVRPELEAVAVSGGPEAKARAQRLLAWLRPGWREEARAEALRSIGADRMPDARGDAEPFAEIPIAGDRLLPFRDGFAYFRASVRDQTVLGHHEVTIVVRRGGESSMWRDRASSSVSPAREVFLPGNAPETRATLMALFLAIERHPWRSPFEDERLEAGRESSTYHVHELQVRGRTAVWIEDAVLEHGEKGAVRITRTNSRELRREEVAGFLASQDGWLRVTGDMNEAEWKAYEAAKQRGRGPVLHGEDRKR